MSYVPVSSPTSNLLLQQNSYADYSADYYGSDAGGVMLVQAPLVLISSFGGASGFLALTIQNTGDSTASPTITVTEIDGTSESWISFQSSSGSILSERTGAAFFTLDPAGLTVGDSYVAQIAVTMSGTTCDLFVRFTVL